MVYVFMLSFLIILGKSETKQIFFYYNHIAKNIQIDLVSGLYYLNAKS